MDLRHTHRLFVPDKLHAGAQLTPTTDQAHHLLHVLRLKEGDVVRLFNDRDGEYRSSLTQVDKRSTQLITHELIRAQSNEPDLWLCPSVIKKAHFDFMIEKATELGISELQPVLTHRTQVREINADRIYAMCREAAEQSDRLSVPAIGLPVSLSDLIDVFPKDRALIVCAEWGEATPIHEILHGPVLEQFKKGAVLTGPEGGFALEELEILRKSPQAFFVRLGPRILRADTAAIAALTCWQAICGDWSANA